MTSAALCDARDRRSRAKVESVPDDIWDKFIYHHSYCTLYKFVGRFRTAV